jgi:hypothetical protein
MVQKKGLLIGGTVKGGCIKSAQIEARRTEVPFRFLLDNGRPALPSPVPGCRLRAKADI